MDSTSNEPLGTYAMGLKDGDDAESLNQDSPPGSLSHRKRTLDNTSEHTQSARSHTSTQRPHRNNHTSKKKANDSKRQHSHLQDAAWGAIQNSGATKEDIGKITVELDKLGMQKKLGRVAASMPRSSSRLDWFYKNPERKATRRMQKSRLRRVQEQVGEQTDRLSTVADESGEQNGGEEADVSGETEMAMDENASNYRRHSN